MGRGRIFLWFGGGRKAFGVGRWGRKRERIRLYGLVSCGYQSKWEPEQCS